MVLICDAADERTLRQAIAEPVYSLGRIRATVGEKVRFV
jgi:hypothetical protein